MRDNYENPQATQTDYIEAMLLRFNLRVNQSHAHRQRISHADGDSTSYENERKYQALIGP